MKQLFIPLITPTTVFQLETEIDRPAASRGPLVILNHGAPRIVADRRDMHPAFKAARQWFRDLGYVTATAMRRGYGRSDGPYAEDIGPCDEADFMTAGLTSADDIAAVLGFMQSQPYVEPSKVILAGMSAGAWGSLALASRQPDGLIAVLNFAGGRGSLKDDENCRPNELVRVAGEYGKMIRVPSLWLYAQNDRSMAPELARRMFAAYQTACPASAKFVALPAFGDNGHRLFNLDAAASWWQPDVAAFLATVL